MTTFRTLDLAVEFYKKSEELRLSGNLRDQLTRAASSIALNLSEGNARPTSRDKKRFYQVAYASLKECQTIFRLLPNKNEELEKLADHLGACLYKLMKAENRSIRDSV
ncbi:MAG TPA: four helix bundle protein [Bdellovibrionota bacterium]|jgi:four helix bundle protein|nr:four helix bundle protein [Bdellovibrionota bacterium]